jgi:NAD(P)-dependent dehydrogenase (short-subunit alcohol dehydrogenase family)
MDRPFDGKVAIVTGGTRGIGRAIVEAFAAAGAHVAFTARDPAGVARAEAELSAAGRSVEGHAFDAGEGPAIRALVADLARRRGRLDVAVANASALVEAATDVDWDRSYAVDLGHARHLCEASLEPMAAGGGGAIVAIASMVAFEDNGYELSAYGAMKAALLYFLRSFVRRAAPRGVRANAISPGVIYCEGGYWPWAEENRPDLFREAVAGTPLGRLGRPEDIAEAALFLAGPSAGFVTGANLVVDGGYLKAMR